MHKRNEEIWFFFFEDLIYVIVKLMGWTSLRGRENVFFFHHCASHLTQFRLPKSFVILSRLSYIFI